MRTSYMLLFALILIGCDGKKEPAPQPSSDNKPTSTSDPPPKSSDSTPVLDIKAPTPPAPAPIPVQAATDWTDKLQEMRSPEKAAAGRMLGKAFAPQTVELTRLGGRFLRLRQEGELFPEFELNILLSTAKDENFAGKTFEFAADAEPGSANVTLYSWASDGRQADPKQFEKCPLRLEFGQESDGRLPGKIYLCLPEEGKSFVAGTFSAYVEPDYAKPPRPDEGACVIGRIALPGKEPLTVNTGVIGQTADGKRVGNLIGITITPDEERSICAIDRDAPAQRTWLVNDLQVGCECRHAHLAPGRYLVFVGTGERYIDWRWVEVKDRATITVDFALDPKQIGALEVVLPKDAKDDVRLTPLDENGNLPDVKEAISSLSLAMKTDVTPKDGKVMLDGLRPGRYRVGAGAVEKNVIVKVNERAMVDLSAP